MMHATRPHVAPFSQKSTVFSRGHYVDIVGAGGSTPPTPTNPINDLAGKDIAAGRFGKPESRVVCRFSCGTASAVATKLALAKYGHERVVITYCDPGSEHPDNMRFLRDCEKWFDHEIVVLKNEKYADTWAIWDTKTFIINRFGTDCTGMLKREPTYSFARPDDILVFGYTADEKDRAAQFRKQNFEITLETPLIDADLRKADCHAMVERAGIELPAMYKLGYHNNNCVGCPKGGMGYWNKIRVDFPDTFERMAATQRRMGKGSGFWRERDTGERITLDDLAPDRGNHDDEPNIECSLLCHIAETTY